MDSNQILRRLDTARNCIHLSAEELQICWGDNSTYWEMVPNHDTEFPNKIARLKAVCWFDVKGEFVCSLPPGTYTVFWRAYLSADARGWESDAVSFTFSKKQNDTEDISRCKCYLKRPRSGVALTQPEPTIRAVGNGWTEYEVGDFAVEAGQGNLALKFAMVATSDYSWKTGLSLDGVVIRPKSLVDVPVPLRLESSSAGVPDAAGDPSNNDAVDATDDFNSLLDAEAARAPTNCVLPPPPTTSAGGSCTRKEEEYGDVQRLLEATYIENNQLRDQFPGLEQARVVSDLSTEMAKIAELLEISQRNLKEAIERLNALQSVVRKGKKLT